MTTGMADHTWGMDLFVFCMCYDFQLERFLKYMEREYTEEFAAYMKVVANRLTGIFVRMAVTCT